MKTIDVNGSVVARSRFGHPNFQEGRQTIAFSEMVDLYGESVLPRAERRTAFSLVSPPLHGHGKHAEILFFERPFGCQ